MNGSMRLPERLFWLIFGSALLLFGAIPMLFYGIFNVGAWTLLLGGLLCLTVFLTDSLLRRRLRAAAFRLFRRCLWSLTALALTAAGLLTVLMAHAAYANPPPADQPSTVVVLGCLIRGDQPSLMLRRRLDRALELLEENSQAVCILSGGQGAGEDYTEAWVMEKYLLGQGVEPTVSFGRSALPIRRKTCAFPSRFSGSRASPGRLVIATDGFHQLRAVLLARREGCSQVYSLSSGTPWGLLPCYWVREWFGMAKELLLP